MAALTKDLALTVRWPNGSRDTSVLFPQGTLLPCAMDTVVGTQQTVAGGEYEAELSSGELRLLHVAGTIPAPQSTDPKSDRVSVDAWIRCRVGEEKYLFYEIHLGPAGMGQPKACHRGGISLT